MRLHIVSVLLVITLAPIEVQAAVVEEPADVSAATCEGADYQACLRDAGEVLGEPRMVMRLGRGKAFCEKGNKNACLMIRALREVAAELEQKREKFENSCKAGTDDACKALTALYSKLRCNAAENNGCAALGMFHDENGALSLAARYRGLACEAGVLQSCYEQVFDLEQLGRTAEAESVAGKACKAGDQRCCELLQKLACDRGQEEGCKNSPETTEEK